MDLLGRYSNQEILHRSLARALDPQRRGQAVPRVSFRKRQQTKLTEGQIDLLIVAYNDGMSMEELASTLSIDRRTVGNHVKRRGVPARGPKLSDQQIAEAVRLYEAGWSVRRIGNHLHVHGESVRYRLKRAGVRLRPRPGSDR